jgi:hypothetical protein
MFVKSIERNEARRLRREEGLPIKAIARTLAVSPDSVSRWVRDVPLTAAQERALRDANPIFNRQRSGNAASSSRARSRRREAQDHGRRLAAGGDPLHHCGCMLFWAEGSRSRNQVCFTNADADMVALFLRFLQRCYGVTDDRVRITINVHLGNGLALESVEAWWLSRLALPRSSLLPSVVDRPSRASRRKRRTLPYGTVRVSVFSTWIVQSIYGAIQAYTGIDRPEWLDLP